MTGFIGNHLWQSTCFVALAALLAFALRVNSAKVRYWVWLGASLKFLVPLALLMSLGSVIHLPVQRAAAIPAADFPRTFIQLAEPFAPGGYSATPPGSSMQWAPLAIGVVWGFGFLGIAWSRCRSWLRVRAALGACTPVEMPIPVPALVGQGAGEPGVVGFFRPVLVLPAQLLKHLNPRQLDAILAHELCHVRRRDNLFAAIHMLVEAIFWFHPLVWWIGSRMVEERELACDEEVLRTGCAPADYAESILKVCRFVAESPMPCVSGVTGADVGKRLRTILAGTIGRDLTASRKAVLAGIGIAALAVPVLIGVLNAPSIRAQSTVLGHQTQPRPTFEVASVKPTMQRHGPRLDAARYSDAASFLSFVVMAYGLNSCAMRAASGIDCPLVSGLPAWAKTPPNATTDLFEIQAKLPDDLRVSSSYTATQVRQGEVVQLDLMLQVLLEDRFHLKLHRETKELPVYTLTVGRNGARLKKTGAPRMVTGVDGASTEHHGFAAFEPVLSPDGSSSGRRRITFQGSSMQQVADSLTTYSDRSVLDRTGLKEEYDFTIDYDVDQGAPNSGGGILANLFSGLTCSGMSSALQDVGLKCESTKGPVEVLVIDHVEKPSEN